MKYFAIVLSVLLLIVVLPLSAVGLGGEVSLGELQVDESLDVAPNQAEMTEDELEEAAAIQFEDPVEEERVEFSSEWNEEEEELEFPVESGEEMLEEQELEL